MKTIYHKNLDKITFDETYQFEFENPLLGKYFHSVHKHIENVKTFKELINTKSHIKHYHFLSNLVNLIIYLEKNNHTLMYLEPDDIVVVNKKHIVFMNSTTVVPIVNNYITINIPIQKSEFISPEMRLIKKIPSKVYYTSCYYSLAQFIFYSFFKSYYSPEDTKIQEIYYSKLYFFLLRCFNQDPKQRKFIFI